MASKTSVHLSSLPSSSSPHLQHHSKKQSLSKKRAESPPPPPVPTAIAKAREDISLRCLQRHDSAIRRIVCQAAFVSVYALSEDTKKWDRAHMQGGLHVVERDISCSLLEEEEEGGRGGEQEKRGTSEDDEEEERREFKRKGREGWQNNSSKRKDKKEDSSSSSFPTSSFSSRIRWRLFVLNQRDTDILVENLDESFEMEGEKNHIFYRVTDQHTGSQRIQAIWVYDDKQRLAVQQALQSIIDECKLRRNFSHLPPLLSSTSCSSSSAAFSSSSLPARSSPAGEGKTGESQPGVVAPSGEDLRLYPEGAFSSSSFAPPSRKNSQHKAAGLHLLSLIRQGGSLSMAPSSPSSSSSSSPSLSLPYSSSDSISKGREGGEGEATGSAACETAGESRKQQKQSERRTTGDDEGGVNEKGGGRGDGDPNVLLSSGKKTGSHEKDLLNEESGMRIHVTDVNAAATAGQSILALVAPGKRHNKEASRSNVSSSSSSSSLPALLPSPTLTPSRIPPDQRSRLGQDSADGGDMSPASLSLTNSGNVERSGFKEGRAKKDFLQENDHRREEDEEDLPVPGNAVTSTTATTATTAFCVEGGGGGGGSQYKTKTSISILSLLENRILRSKQGEEDLSQCQISEGEKNQREEEEERERRERNEASGHARHARRLGSEGRGGATSGEGEDREGRKEERKHPDRKTYRDKGGGTALLDMLKRRATPADGDLFKTATGDASQISSHCHTSLLQSSSSSSSSSSSLPPSLSSSFSSAHAYFESSSSSISASPPLLPCPHPSKASRKKAEGRSINNGGGGILLLPSQHRPDLSSSSSRHATVHPQRSHEENSSSSSCLSSSQSHQRRASSLSVQMGHSGVKTPGGEEEEGREKSEGLRKNSRNGKIITLPSHLNHSHDEDQRKSLTCGRSFVNRDDSILGLPSSSSSTPSSSSPSLSSSSSPSSMRPSSSDPRRAGGGEGSEGVENYYLSLCINSSFSPIHPSTAPHRLANSTSHVRLSGNASSSDSASSSSACTVLNLSSSSGGHLEEEEEKKDTEERGEEGIVVGGGEGVSLSHAGGGEGTSKPNGVLSLLFGKTRQTGRKVEVSSLFVSGDRQQEIEEKESHRGGAGGEGEKKEEQERSENEEEEGGGMIEVSRERLRSAVQTVMQSELFLDMVWRELKKQSSRNPNSQGMKREEKHEALSCHRSKNSRKKKNA